MLNFMISTWIVGLGLGAHQIVWRETPEEKAYTCSSVITPWGSGDGAGWDKVHCTICQVKSADTEMYGCSGQHHSGGVHSVCQERGANPSCLHWLGRINGSTCVKGLIVYLQTNLSFREGSPQCGRSMCLYTPEAGWMHSFRGEWERIMGDRTANRGFD